MGLPVNVDPWAAEALLWRVCGLTFSITYSIVKIAQTRIVEPIHRPFDKKMLAHLSAEII